MAKARPSRQICSIKAGEAAVHLLSNKCTPTPSFLLPIKCTLEIQLVSVLFVVSSLKRPQRCLITDGCQWGENCRKRFIKWKFKKVKQHLMPAPANMTAVG